ncbi:hypothetical protein CRYUN_Cryun04dG0156400 [Craigia yunnanensis]
MESEGNSEKKMSSKTKKGSNIIPLTGAAALLTLAVSLAITAINNRRNSKKKDLPGCNFRVNLSASEILKLADRIIAKSKEVHDAVASVPLDKVTYKNVISPLAELEAQQFPLVQSCVVPNLVSTSDKVRKASAEAEKKIDAHASSCSNQEDVYGVVKAFAAKEEWMGPDARRYIQCLIRDFERNGLNLTATKREEVQRLRAQIDELSFLYVKNLNDDSTYLLFREDELDGLPTEFLKTLEKVENGMFKVTLKSHHVAAVLELCKIGKTRRLVAMTYGKRSAKVNLSVLEDLVQVRHKFARLLGFSNYADYALNLRMAKTSSKVLEFLEDISSSLSNLANKELSVLKELKKQEEGELPFGVEDLPYYVKKVEQQEFDVDFGALKQYFPVNLVLSGIFKIFQDLFGLRFEEIVDADVWHSDVRVFSVFDLSSGELLGYFYLDMYTREGKYGQTCVVALQNGSVPFNGARQIPVALLISQLQKDIGGIPSLLRFSEVVSLFHEFGHVVQHLCNHASFARLSGLHVDPDFVEIPAQVLENWCYESFSLKLISGFHQVFLIKLYILLKMLTLLSYSSIFIQR